MPVLEGIDTRRLTRHLRERGAMRGVVAEGRQPSRELTAQLLASPSMEGLDLASRATVRERVDRGRGPARRRVRLRHEAQHRPDAGAARAAGSRWCRRRRRRPQVRALNPDGLFLSNGPGDPAAVDYALDTIRDLAGGGLPTFGICLGHQLVGLAFGGLDRQAAVRPPGRQPPGARSALGPGADHHAKPWLRGGWRRGRRARARPALEVTHLNLNDGTIEGVRHRELPLFAVQYHPEAAPGPHDAFPHFAEFMALAPARNRVRTANPLTDNT